MNDSASYTQVTGKLDLIDRREILRTWQNVCIGISCSQCQFYNDDAMSGDCLLERWVYSLPSAQPEERTKERTETHACDLISRQAAIDAYGDWYVEEGPAEGFIGTVKQLLEGLPSAQSERKKGKWIDKSGGIEGAWNYCSVCGEQAIDLYDFCPNCGADMRGEQE